MIAGLGEHIALTGLGIKDFEIIKRAYLQPPFRRGTRFSTRPIDHSLDLRGYVQGQHTTCHTRGVHR